MKNYKLTLRYDGSAYKGWQRQGNTDNTIEARVEDALTGILGEAIEVSASGRTDAGVHAMGQVVSFRSGGEMKAEELLSRLRKALPGDIGAVSLEEAPPRFHARLSARGKTYVYRVWNSPEPCIFERKYVYIVSAPLDIGAMRRAAYSLCGDHDFLAFCSAKSMKHSSVRTLRSVEIHREGNEIIFTYNGDGFLYNMVRIITGTLLEVGLGKRDAGAMGEILASRRRENAGETAPAKGLFLWEVEY